MKATHAIAFILVIIGALAWGIIGVSGVNLVAYLGDTIARIVYVLVGLSGLYLVFTHKRDCKMCESKMSAAPTSSM